MEYPLKRFLMDLLLAGTTSLYPDWKVGEAILDSAHDASDVVRLPIGRKMVCWGKCSDRQRIKWRYPAKVGKWKCPTPYSPILLIHVFF